jgi:hypothetical protein
MIKKFFNLFKTNHKTIKITQDGEFFNIHELYQKINQQYFEGQLDLKITWVGNRESKPRRRVLFGSYDQEKKLIKIHRRLDQAHVPEYFIAYVIYHEMLHHVLPPIFVSRRRRKIHHPAFIQREKQFQDYELAQTFSENAKKTWFRQSFY